MLNFTEAIPLSLYIHLPWCVRKCPYCDFNSHEKNDGVIEEKKYIKALVRDLETELPRIWGRQVISVFIGGGTPSLFSAEALDHLISALRARLNLNPDTEITLEANPGTAEAEKFKAYRELGINRLSIGVQSFNDAHLKALGRIHNAEEAHNAIAMARAAGFENFNIDLMFGLPQQSIDEALQDLKTAIATEAKHISWYQLTIEPNTVFNAKPPALPDEDVIWDMQQSGKELLVNRGFNQYEVSAYAQKNHQCRHNINYWMFGDYLGIGAGAHGKLTNVAEAKIERFARHKIPARYMELAGMDKVITETRVVSEPELPLEFMMNALRLVDGIPPQLFLERTGLPLNKIEKELSTAESKQWLSWQLDELKPTETGMRYLNDLLGVFMK